MRDHDCPECGNPLMETVEGPLQCIDCGWSGPPEDASVNTSSPLDVRTSQGEVVCYVPTGGPGGERPVRFSPQQARNLAEALDQSADDAERRE